MRLRRGIGTACLVEDFGVLRDKGRDFLRARFLRKAYNLSLRFLRQAMTSSNYAGNPRFGYLMIWQTSTLDWTTGWRCEDADGGDDCTRSTGAREGQERSGDCPVAEVVVGNG